MTAAMQTSATEFLSTLVPCERHVSLFPAGMPVRACLRRQVERQRGAKGALGPPTKPYCASGECALGYAMAEAAKARGIAAAPCSTCGAALFDGAACEVCAAAAMEKTKPAKGFLPLVGAPAQDRIWKPGEVPDVPIGRAPGAPTAGEEAAAAVARRVREAAPRVAPSTMDPRPAPPAKESDMRGVPTKPRTCCDSKGTKHRSWCEEAGGPGKPPVEKPELPAKPPRALKAVEKPRKVVQTREVALKGGRDLELLAIDELLELRDAVVSEIRRRKDAAEKALATLNSALGEAA
jgi:hypothetical protein